MPPIVVGVDDVGNCHAALSYATTEAVASECPLTLVHVLDAGYDDGQAPDFTPAEEYVKQASDGQVSVQTSVRQGPVAKALVEMSRTAALVVVEHRRLSRLRRHSSPSVAGRLAGRVRSRVVSVPEDWKIGRGSRRRIVVGVDAIDQDVDELLERAFARAARDDAGLLLIHAWSMASAYDDALVENKVEEEWSATYRRRLSARLDALQLGVGDSRVEISVVHRPAAKALIELSDRADLLMLGRGRTVHPLLHGLGSVPRAVLEDSRCPVEVVARLRV